MGVSWKIRGLQGPRVRVDLGILPRRMPREKINASFRGSMKSFPIRPIFANAAKRLRHTCPRQGGAPAQGPRQTAWMQYKYPDALWDKIAQGAQGRPDGQAPGPAAPRKADVVSISPELLGGEISVPAFVTTSKYRFPTGSNTRADVSATTRKNGGDLVIDIENAYPYMDSPHINGSRALQRAHHRPRPLLPAEPQARRSFQQQLPPWQRDAQA